MVKMVVSQGCFLLYPDGSRRGAAGYTVDTESSHEAHALAGQLDKLERCADYISADAVVFERLTAPHAEMVSPSAAPKAKKKAKAKKKVAKKKATRR